MRIAIVFLLFASALLAQRGTYSHERTTTGSSEAVTVHLPTGSVRTAKLIGISIYCATVCTATLSRDGTAPTATASTAVKINSNQDAAAVIPYNASNVGAGTTIKSYNIAATEEKGIDFPNKGILAGENVTVTPSLSGARVYFLWSEF